VTGCRYHYILSLQFERRGGVQQFSYVSGVYEPARGQTRADVFADLLQQATRQGGGTNPVPLLFSLEPDDLEADR